MTRLLSTLLLVFFVLGCNNPKTDNSSNVQNIKDSLENSFLTNSTLNNDTINSLDRSNWTTLDFLNKDSLYSFVAEDSINGIGVVTLSDSFDYGKKLIIYDLTKTVLSTILLEDTNIITTFNKSKYDRHDTAIPFIPRLFGSNPDYFRLTFNCIDEQKDYYVVVVNEKIGQKGLIKKTDKYFKFESFEKYIKDWSAPGIDFDRSINPIRKLPNDNADIILNPLQSNYKIWQAQTLLFNGDWIEIQIDETKEKGWIRWRKGNTILIRIYFAC